MPIPKYKINQDGEKIKLYEQIEDFDLRFKDILDDIEGKIGCWIEGNLEIDKVSGNFHISFHNYWDEYKKLV